MIRVSMVVIFMLPISSCLLDLSHSYSRRAAYYARLELKFRAVVARSSFFSHAPRDDITIPSILAEYYCDLKDRYRRAAWRPWVDVRPPQLRYSLLPNHPLPPPQPRPARKYNGRMIRPDD